MCSRPYPHPFSRSLLCNFLLCFLYHHSSNHIIPSKHVLRFSIRKHTHELTHTVFISLLLFTTNVLILLFIVSVLPHLTFPSNLLPILLLPRSPVTFIFLNPAVSILSAAFDITDHPPWNNFSHLLHDRCFLVLLLPPWKLSLSLLCWLLLLCFAFKGWHDQGLSLLSL